MHSYVRAEKATALPERLIVDWACRYAPLNNVPAYPVQYRYMMFSKYEMHMFACDFNAPHTAAVVLLMDQPANGTKACHTLVLFMLSPRDERTKKRTEETNQPTAVD